LIVPAENRRNALSTNTVQLEAPIPGTMIVRSGLSSTTTRLLFVVVVTWSSKTVTTTSRALAFQAVYQQQTMWTTRMATRPRYHRLPISSSSRSSSSKRWMAPPSTQEENKDQSSSSHQAVVSSQGNNNDQRAFPIQKTDEEWKAILTPEQYYVLRKEGTETPGASPLNNIKAGIDEGTFCCAGCGSPLFVADAKFDSGTGWPSFFEPISNSAIKLETDYKLVIPRTECVCSQCGGHLGHVFEDGPEPTGQRYCMNGAAMQYVSNDDNPDLAQLVSQQRQLDPFKLAPQQVLPSIIVNALITAFFLSSFASGDRSSPVAILTIVPALYYGFLTTKSISKLL
jgi:peptide-methionine (R)-S-oxide reductase